MSLKTEATIESLQAKVAELSDQVDSLKRGASRYLWLRDMAGNTKGVRPVVVLVDENDELVDGSVLSAFRDRKQLDDFVDRFIPENGKSRLEFNKAIPGQFDDDLPVAVVMDAGRDGLVLCELQAELPPADTQIFARRALSQVFGLNHSMSAEELALAEKFERAAFERAFLEIYYPFVARQELRMIPGLFDRDVTRYSNTLGEYLRENIERDWTVWKARSFLSTNLIQKQADHE